MKLKRACSLEGKLWQKSTETSLCRQRSVIVSYGFSSSHVWTWALDHKEGWMLKNWCCQSVVLEGTLESPLDSKEIKPVNPKENQPWIFIELMLKLQYFDHLMWKADSMERLWCWERWKVKGESSGRGWDGCIAPPTQWTWIWANSGRPWRTRELVML